MALTTNPSSISHELLIQQNGHGIQLVEPDTQSNRAKSLLSTHDMLSLPMNIYFLNSDSRVQSINEISAQTCGYASTHDAINRSITEIAKKHSANHLIRHDSIVMKTQRMMVFEESFIRPDEQDFLSLSLKFPWYSQNKITGVLGISIVLSLEQQMNTAESLSILLKTGIINPGFQKYGALDIYLSETETKVLSLLTKGYTAKMTGRKLDLSNRTVEHHLARLKLKTNTYNKGELKDWAIEHFMQHHK